MSSAIIQWRYYVSGVRPASVTKRELLANIFRGRPNLVQTLAKTAWLSKCPEHPEHHGWLVFSGRASTGGDLSYTVDSVEQTVHRINNQEYPPLLPARIREKQRRCEGGIPKKKIRQRKKLQ